MFIKLMKKYLLIYIQFIYKVVNYVFLAFCITPLYTSH